MLRETDVFDARGFSFAEFGEQKAPALVTVAHGPQGASATIADAHLLFNSDFTRSGNDLHIDGRDGDRAIVRDYFGSGERVALLSGDGARISPDLVEALTRSVAPHQYAQAAAPVPAASDAVGRVVTASPDSTILRNGVPVAVGPGDPVLRADVLQTARGTMAVTFNDGSTLNLTANTRIVVSEFIYAPNGTGNSQLLDLVQGSLTFISGEVAHSGNMSIGTPVATMGIRGTVGGVTTASDGTVQFYVSQSATGAVIINQQGQIIANVVQDGPLIVIRPVGPLQIIAEEIQKSPAQLAVELQALQQIVNIKAVGDQLLQQFFQPQQQQQGPNPQSGGPHTTIPSDDKLKITLFTDDATGGNGPTPPATHAVIEQVLHDHGAPPVNVSVPLPVNLPPVTFAPLSVTTAEDTPLVFSGAKAISVIDNDSSTLTVTLSVTHGVLALGSLAGLTFSAGGTGLASMTFSGSPAAIAAALNGLTYTPSQDYFGPAALSITKTDGNSAPTTTTVALDVTPVNDAPVFDSGTYNFSITGNLCAGATVGTVNATDVDSATLVYAIVSGNDDGLFSVDSHGHVVTTGPAGYYSLGSRDLVVSATDSDGLSATTAVHIGIDLTGNPVYQTLASSEGTSVKISQYGATNGFEFAGGGNVTTPGTPEDRIVLGFTFDSQSYVVHQSPMMDDATMTPVSAHAYSQDNVNYFSTTLSAGHGVTLTQTIGLGTNANYFTTDIVVYNGSGSALSDLRFLRNIDPDQDVAGYGSFSTSNDVLQNPTNGAPVAAVSAVGPYSHVSVVLVADGSGWRASAPPGLVHSDPYDSSVYSNPADPNGAIGDRGITLVYDGGTLAAGASLHVSYITTANVATTGANALVGTAGNNVIDGLGGGDLMFGLAGADTFAFKPSYGAATVADFSGHAGQGDVIDLSGFAFADFNAFTAAVTIHDIGTGGDHSTKIDFGNGDTLTLAHVDPTHLTAADFIFHPLV